jgi:hypothetical protein
MTTNSGVRSRLRGDDGKVEVLIRKVERGTGVAFGG